MKKTLLDNQTLVYLNVGLALESIQSLEFVMAHYIVLRQEKNELSVDDMFLEIQKLHASQTLGDLLKTLKSNQYLEASLIEMLNVFCLNETG